MYLIIERAFILTCQEMQENAMTRMSQIFTRTKWCFLFPGPAYQSRVCQHNDSAK